MIVIVIYVHDVLYAEIAGANFCLLQVLSNATIGYFGLNMLIHEFIEVPLYCIKHIEAEVVDE